MYMCVCVCIYMCVVDVDVGLFCHINRSLLHVQGDRRVVRLRRTLPYRTIPCRVFFWKVIMHCPPSDFAHYVLTFENFPQARATSAPSITC